MTRVRLKTFFTNQPYVHIVADALLILASLYISLWLRVGFDEISDHIHSLNALAPIFLLIRLVCFFAFGVYLIMWRYVSLYDASKIVKAVAFSSVLIIATSYFLKSWFVLPRSLYFIDFMVLAFLLLGARAFRRYLYESESGAHSSTAERPRVLIYGAGNSGRFLAQRLHNDPSLQLDLVGYIDDNPDKLGRVIGGAKVLGAREDLEALLEKTNVQSLVIAITKPTGPFMRDIVGVARQFNIQPQVISDFTTEGPQKKSMELFREVKLQDLLNRQPAEIDMAPIQKMIQGETVLITGAGGSIGSEIARQVSRLKPKNLLLLDHSEFNLYEIDKELRLDAKEIKDIVPLLIDIKDLNTLEQVFKTYKPTKVFHAAAYKHVHLVENNPHSAILNNILGTQNLLDLSKSYMVENFVLISSDKAVNPVGVMGATKRVCEFMTSSMGNRATGVYNSVRFGNVLGSSGSLIPLLQRQILEGGPVTITHQDMTRYFMLIPESVSLVLTSAAIAKSGDISVLRMGEPVKIVNIAKSLIALMGKTEKEIQVLFTGLRPGEKMFEELYLSGNELETQHPDILTMPKGDQKDGALTITYDEIQNRISNIVDKAKWGSHEALDELKELVNANYIIEETPDPKKATDTKSSTHRTH